jgi:hypothetical protein
MNQFGGFYVSRGTVYTFFLVAFTVIFFVIVWWLSIERALEVSSQEMSVKGTVAELRMTLTNISNHALRNIVVGVRMGGQYFEFPVGDLNGGESAEFSQELDIPSDLSYVVEVKAPFTRTVSLSFKLEEATVDPLTVTVSLSENFATNWSMVVGREYTLTKEICNRSNEALPNIRWEESATGSYFKEPMFPTSFSLGVRECKNLYSKLTPVTPGVTTFEFKLIVGDFKKGIDKQVTILQAG